MLILFGYSTWRLNLGGFKRCTSAWNGGGTKTFELTNTTYTWMLGPLFVPVHMYKRYIRYIMGNKITYFRGNYSIHHGFRI